MHDLKKRINFVYKTKNNECEGGNWAGQIIMKLYMKKLIYCFFFADNVYEKKI